MTTVFDQAVADIFADPNLGVAATYAPPAGAPVACTVTLRRPNIDGPLGTPGLVLAPADQDLALVAELRKAEVAAPERGATLTVNGHAYPVRDVRLHASQLTWVLALGKPA